MTRRDTNCHSKRKAVQDRIKLLEQPIGNAREYLWAIGCDMTRTRILVLVAITLLGCFTWCLEAAPHQDDAKLVGNGMGSPKSTNLTVDIAAMWSVAPKLEGRDWVASSDAADTAAVRVFNTVNLIGMSREEVSGVLRFDLRSPDYGYVAPFYPVATNVIPIRIDNGRYGWQFDIIMGGSDRVVRVECRGIE